MCRSTLVAAGLARPQILHGESLEVLEEYAAACYRHRLGGRITTTGCWDHHTWVRELTRLAFLCHAEEHGYMDVLELPWHLAVVTPGELAVAAYFPRVMDAALQDDAYWQAVQELIRILAAPETFPGRQHLIRYRDFWNDEAVAFALDELGPSRTEWPAGAAVMPPRRLLNVLRAEAEERGAGKDVQYEHLEELADGPVGQDGLQLQILRSQRHVLAVGAALHNCAACYTASVQRGAFVLVVLADTTRTPRHPRGRPLALAGWTPGQAEWGHAPVGVQNKAAHTEVRRRFDLFLPVLVAWHRDKRNEAEEG